VDRTCTSTCATPARETRRLLVSPSRDTPLPTAPTAASCCCRRRARLSVADTDSDLGPVRTTHHQGDLLVSVGTRRPADGRPSPWLHELETGYRVLTMQRAAAGDSNVLSEPTSATLPRPRQRW
jgi:hypothetical protein